MGIIFLFGGVMGISFILSMVTNEFSDRNTGDWWCFTGLLFAIMLFCTLSTLINKNARHEQLMQSYESTKTLVECYSPGDYGNKAILLKKVIEINDDIATHKAYVGNFWTGIWYSDEIAQLEPIIF